MPMLQVRLAGAASPGTVSVLVNDVEVLEPETLRWSVDVPVPAGGTIVQMVAINASGASIRKRVAITPP